LAPVAGSVRPQGCAVACTPPPLGFSSSGVLLRTSCRTWVRRW